MSNKLKYGTARVDARLLMQTLAYVASHGGVTSRELADELELSQITIKRLIYNARSQYGVVITFRRDGTMPSRGEFTVENWGVFDRNKVMAFLAAAGSKGGLG
jgi:hypothetical protein